MGALPHGEVTPATRCTVCGEGQVRAYRRLADVGPVPLRVAIAAVAVAFAVVGAIRGVVGLVTAGGAVLVLALVIGRLGVRWWGGTRCTRCGHTVMMR